MTEPASLPVRSKTGVKNVRWLAAGLLGLATLGLAGVSLRNPRPATPTTVHAAIAKSPVLEPPGKPTSTTVRVSEPTFHPWPPKPEVIGPPAGTGSPAAVASHPPDIAAKPQASLPSRPEPAAPSLAELKDESLRTGDQVTAEAAREVLLDDKKSSALKLVVIDKLRTQDPEEAVPVLVAFLEHPATPAAAYTKPTAVKALADFRDPRADRALEKLAQSSTDERVRLTIAALQAKERSR